MSSQETFEEVQQPTRMALYAGIFVAGLLGGAAVSGTSAHGPQPARPVASAVQAGAVSAVFTVQAPTSDPSLPDAGAALRHRKHDRIDVVAPTF